MTNEEYKEQEISCYDELTCLCVGKSINIIQDKNILITSLPLEI